MVNTLEAARRYAAAGLSVIPIKADGSKQPDASALPKYVDRAEGHKKRGWKPFQEQPPTEDMICDWFANECCRGIGVVWGRVSGNGEALDFDEVGLYDVFAALAVNQGYSNVIESMPLVETPSGGRHLYYRCEVCVEKSQKLAERLVDVPVGTQGGRLTDDRRVRVKTLIETRGEGGYTLVPGSPAECHPSRQPYRFLRGGPETLPTISAAERGALLALASQFNEHLPPKQIFSEDKSDRVPHDGMRPGDDYNRRGDYEVFLERHGWQRTGQSGDKVLWRRPGKQGRSISATGNYAGTGLFYIFSSNASPFEPLRAYRPFAVYALLEHAGDFSAAAKRLASEGYGDSPRSQRSWDAGMGPKIANGPDEGDDTTGTKQLPHVLPNVAQILSNLPVKITETGIIIEAEASGEERQKIFRGIVNLSTDAQIWFRFAIGDAYNALPGDYGKRADWVRENFGKGRLKQLKNEAWTARHWPSDKRNMRVPWSFYVETADKIFGFTDKISMLERYTRRELTVGRIRDIKKDRKKEHAKNSTAEHRLGHGPEQGHGLQAHHDDVLAALSDEDSRLIRDALDAAGIDRFRAHLRSLLPRTAQMEGAALDEAPNKSAPENTETKSAGAAAGEEASELQREERHDVVTFSQSENIGDINEHDLSIQCIISRDQLPAADVDLFGDPISPEPQRGKTFYEKVVALFGPCTELGFDS